MTYSLRHYMVALFGTAALAAVALYELRMGAARGNSLWVIPYGMYILLTAGVAQTFVSWYRKDAARWVAIALVPLAIVGVSTMVTGVAFVLGDLVFGASERSAPNSGPLWAPVAVGVLGAIVFAKTSWPALVLGHFVAAAVTWRLAASETMRSNKSLERGRDG